MLDLLAQTVPLALVAATPLLLAVQGELLVQRSGIINLGVEGMLLAGAFGGSLAAATTGSIVMGTLGSVVAAVLVATLFGVFTISLRANQIISGAAINLLVLGASSFAYREMPSVPPPPRVEHDVIVWLAWVVAPIGLAILLWNTGFGLRLRASGENPDTVPVARYRWIALMMEAVLAGLGGTHLALALSNGFAENMSAGRGFVALAVVIFGRWSVRGALAGTALFGLAAALQFALQAAGHGVPFHLLLATPYVVTLLILCGVTGRVRAPEALGDEGA